MVLLPRLFADHIRKIEVEDYLGLVHPAQNNEICIHHAVVPVDHEVWIDPVVERAFASPHRACLRFGAFAHDRAPLQTMSHAVLDHVVLVIKHAVETSVQVRHVISTVEIIIDKHFPIAVEAVMTPLEPMQVREWQLTRLRNQFLAKKIAQRWPMVQSDEQPVLPLAEFDRYETILRAIEVAHT